MFSSTCGSPLVCISPQDHPNVDRAAHLYARVTSCYCESCPGPVRRAVEQTVGKVLLVSLRVFLDAEKHKPITKSRTWEEASYSAFSYTICIT